MRTNVVVARTESPFYLQWGIFRQCYQLVSFVLNVFVAFHKTKNYVEVFNQLVDEI